jgi:hypothetical protein
MFSSLRSTFFPLGAIFVDLYGFSGVKGGFGLAVRALAVGRRSRLS